MTREEFEKAAGEVPIEWLAEYTFLRIGNLVVKEFDKSPNVVAAEMSQSVILLLGLAYAQGINLGEDLGDILKRREQRSG